MHRGHRITPLQHPTGRAKQLSQPAELGHQHGRVLGRELPRQPHLRKVPVRILHRHRGLPRTAQPMQRHYPRPRPGCQPGIQVGQQLLPPRQQRRPGRQRHRQLRHGSTRRLHVGPDRGAADGGHSSRPELAGDPGPG
jgi:hypothetical protein